MAITNYSELKLAISEALEDDSAEVSAFIPKAIYLTEERLSHALDMRTQIETTTASAFELVSIPGGGVETQVSTGIKDTDFVYFNDVFHCGTKLDNVAYSFTKEFNQHETSAGTSARYYSMKATPSILYVSPPVSVGLFEILFTKRAQPLTNGNQSNDLMAKAPELLYYGSMAEMSFFMKNWETKQFWDARFNEDLQLRLNMTRRERTDEGQQSLSNSETQSTGGSQ